MSLHRTTQQAPAGAPPEWSSPKPETVARPSWYPAAFAFGVTLTAWGLITSAIVFAMGMGILILSVSGWIGDIRDERKRD